jgi:DNA-binding response OmpR family regulator
MSINEKTARRSAVFRRAELPLAAGNTIYSELLHPLSKTELFIFVRLLKNMAAVTVKSEIAHDILPGVAAKSRTVDVHLSSLRQKLPADLRIENVHGYGVRLQRCD